MEADEVERLNDILYKYIVERAGQVLRKKGKGFSQLTEKYVKVRMEDAGIVFRNSPSHGFI
jgi:hypothetical protein